MLQRRIAISLLVVLFLFANAWAVELYGLDEKGLVNLASDMFGKNGSAIEVEPELAPFCGTPLILGLSTVWSELSDEAREQISSYVHVPDFSAIAPVTYEGRGKGEKKSVWPHGYSASNQYQTDHFNVKWGSSGSFSNETIQMIGQALEDAWDIEVENLGYPDPSGADEYYIDFYIGNTGDDVPNINFEGAYTTIYGDYPFPSYIVIHPDIVSSQSATRDVSAHEFFHVIQFGIVVRQNCFYGSDDMWWWEATATWMEDVVWDDINNYAYYIFPYAETPQESLPSDKSFYFPYSRAIWGKYLSENHGGNDAIKSIWTGCSNRGVLYGTDAYLSSFDGYSLKKAYGEFMAKNAVLDYEEGDLYERLGIEFARQDVHNSYPVLEYVKDSDTLPRYLGANIVEFDAYTVDSPKNLVIEFDGESSSHNYDVEWRAQVLIEHNDGSYETGTIALNENAYGSATIEDFGGNVYRVFLIPCVVEWDFAGNEGAGVSYAYSAKLKSPSSGNNGGGGGDNGCGCSF